MGDDVAFGGVLLDGSLPARDRVLGPYHAVVFTLNSLGVKLEEKYR